jgi:phosphatidylserine synthase
MKTFLKGIAIIWILIVVIGSISRLASFNVSSNDGLGGFLGTLFGIGIITSPSIWYLVKNRNRKS